MEPQECVPDDYAGGGEDVIRINVGTELGMKVYDGGGGMMSRKDYYFGLKLVPDNNGGCACPPAYGYLNFQTIDVSVLDPAGLVISLVQAKKPEYTISTTACRIVY